MIKSFINTHPNGSSHCFDLEVEKVLISSMKIFVDSANNILQIGSIMKYKKPRNSLSKLSELLEQIMFQLW